MTTGHPGEDVCTHCQGSDHHTWVIREDFLDGLAQEEAQKSVALTVGEWIGEEEDLQAVE